MQKLLVILGIVATIGGVACSQQPANPSEQAGTLQSDQASPSRPEPGQQIAEGVLVTVDSEAHLISIRGSDGTEMTFRYSDQTEVEGANNTVEGLAKEIDGHLKVSYLDPGPLSPVPDVALKIEFIPHGN